MFDQLSIIMQINFNMCSQFVNYHQLSTYHQNVHRELCFILNSYFGITFSHAEKP